MSLIKSFALFALVALATGKVVSREGNYFWHDKTIILSFSLLYIL
jgi:hypothetical protein